MSSAARCGRLETAVVDLQRRLGESEKLNTYLLSQLSETNLKLTYVLRWFKFQRTVQSPLVDPATGKPSISVEQLTLEAMYARDRDRFIDILMQEHDHARTQAESADTAGAGAGKARKPRALHVVPQNGDGTDARVLAEHEQSHSDEGDSAGGARSGDVH